MMEKQPSKLFSFRVPGDVAREIDEAVRRSGKDKSAWLLSAVLEGLGKADNYCSPESRLETLIGKMEGLLHGVGDSANKTLNSPLPINEPVLTAKEVIAQMVEESRRLSIQSSNKMIIARLNKLGLRPARGGAWTTSTVDNMKRRMKTSDD
ncbi:hypothetical protein [Serratia marcescens]|uniref:hypothetical protein n=1 Tax=Serratia marcescens TaxID=615 RepID=UPI003D775CE6